MKVSKRDSSNHEDDTHLDIDGIKDSIHFDLETADLPLLQGLQDALDTEDEIFPELEYVEEDSSCTLFTFEFICGRPGS